MLGWSSIQFKGSDIGIINYIILRNLSQISHANNPNAYSTTMKVKVIDTESQYLCLHYLTFTGFSIIPDRWQSKTLLTIDKWGSKIARNSVYDCHLSPLGRQMTIKKTLFLMILDLPSSIV